MALKDKAVEISINTLISYLEKNPEENLPRLMDVARKFMGDEKYKSKLDQFDLAIKDKNSNWHRLLVSLFDDIDTDVRKTLARNFIVNAFYKWSQSRDELAAKYDCSIPWTMLIDPTSACNLHCNGCWAAEYGNKLNLSFETLDSLISQAEELNMHFFLFSGGEPLVKKDLIVNDLQDKPEGLDVSVLPIGSVSGLPEAPHPYG